MREYKVFDFRFGDGRQDFQDAPQVTPTDVLAVYSGYIQDGDYQTVDSRHDFIVDQPALTKCGSNGIQQSCSGIDFDQNMVVVATVVGPNEIVMTTLTSMVISCSAASTRMRGIQL